MCLLTNTCQGFVRCQQGAMRTSAVALRHRAAKGRALPMHVGSGGTCPGKRCAERSAENKKTGVGCRRLTLNPKSRDKGAVHSSGPLAVQCQQAHAWTLANPRAFSASSLSARASPGNGSILLLPLRVAALRGMFFQRCSYQRHVSLPDDLLQVEVLKLAAAVLDLCLSAARVD